MDKEMLIRDIFAREILDSRGNPTIEAEVLAGENIVGEPQFHPALQQENMRLWSFGSGRALRRKRSGAGS